jgi:diguanylate cyclase (GGDEF)-like protein
MQEQAVRIVESVIEITQSRDRELIGCSLGRTILEMLPCREVTLYHLHQRREPVVLVLGIHVDSSGEIALPGRGAGTFPPISAALSDGIIRAMISEAAVEVPTAAGGASHVIYPLFRGRDTLSGFCVLRRDAVVENERSLVCGMLKIYENFLALLDESQSDKLTGLLNRHTFDDQIMKIIANPVSRPSRIQLRPGEVPRKPADETFTYWLALVDIDHFKAVNDTHGHIAGDDVLIRLARIMRSQFRSDDLVFRYGGEEFIVVIRAKERRDAVTALERFRRNVESQEFPKVGRMTVSIGFTQISRYQAPAAFLDAADKALYHSKANGRNRTSCHEELVASGVLPADRRR